MYRLFNTHLFRKSILLSDFWNLTIDEKTIKMPIPSCVESIPAYCNYKGECVFETTERFCGDLRLTFKGVSHTAKVCLDGKYLGEHYGAYGEFSFILKDIKDDDHTITVIADNSYSEKSALHIDNDYYSYLGITRPVLLEQLDRVYIKWIHITPVYSNGQWSIKVSTQAENISNEDLELKLKLFLSKTDKTQDTIKCIELPIKLNAREVNTFECVMHCDSVESYSPENPVMYYVHGHITDTNDCVIDDLIERFGFREIKVDGKEILFNGVPLK